MMGKKKSKILAYCILKTNNKELTILPNVKLLGFSPHTIVCMPQDGLYFSGLKLFLRRRIGKGLTFKGRLSF